MKTTATRINTSTIVRKFPEWAKVDRVINGVPIYNILVDHPRNYHDCLDHEVPMMRVVCIDRHHERFIREYYPKVRKT